MAEPIGGLSSVAPMQEEQPVMKAPEADPVALARAEYENVRRDLIDRQRALVESLESRVSQPADLLLSISAALGAPTRGGSFSEGFGSAAGAMQKYRAEEDARTQQLAKMRMELGAQEAGLGKERYELAKKDQAMKILLGSGIDPQSLSNPQQIPHSKLRALGPNTYMAIASNDPELGKVVQNAFNMSVEIEKLAREDFKNGMSRAELIAKFGPEVIGLLPAAPGAPAAPAAPAAEAPKPTAVAPAKPAVEAKEFPKVSAEEQLARDQKSLEILKSELASNPNDPNLIKQIRDLEGRISTAKPQEKVVAPEDAMSLAQRQELIAKRALARDEEAKAQRGQIISWDPVTIGRANVELKELRQIAKNYPKIFNVLGGSGFFDALGKAAQEGAQAGRLGSFSLPVDTFIRGATLSKDEKIAAARAGQILANQFFLNAKDSKSVIGPAISNSDTMLLKAPLATMENPSQFINYWAKENLLFNLQRQELNKSFRDFEQTKGPGSSMSSYFASNSPYHSIADKYTNLYSLLVQRDSPYARK